MIQRSPENDDAITSVKYILDKVGYAVEIGKKEQGAKKKEMEKEAKIKEKKEKEKDD